MKNKDVINFIFELGMLRRVKHEGVKLAGVNNPESVADHNLRAAQLGFILAKMENYENPFEVCAILVFHDIAECRTGDIHYVGKRYVRIDEEKALKDQVQKLGRTGEEIARFPIELHNKNSKAGVIAHDADELEQAFTAKEYIEKGYVYVDDWLKNIDRKSVV